MPLAAPLPPWLRRRLSPLKRVLLRLRARAIGWMVRSASAVHDHDYVFVVTYGRSGSTLLMGLLNAIPGYRVLGENGNALYRLYQAYSEIAGAHQRHTDPFYLLPRSSWYGAPRLRPDQLRVGLVETFVATVLRPEPGDRVLGFKEIRYTHDHMEDLAEFLEFVRSSFPGCKIVFNHRDVAATARSSWWARVEHAERKIRAADDRFHTFPADHRHFHFYYDRIDESLTHVRALLAFLGEELDDAVIREVLGTEHGTWSPVPVLREPSSSSSRLVGG